MSDIESSARLGTGMRPERVRSKVSWPAASMPRVPAAAMATTRGSSRCSTAWMRAPSDARSSEGSTGTASWATIGPPSSVSSTRCTVTPGDRDPRRERVVDGVEPRERRQQRGMDVDDAAAEGAEGVGAEDAQEAGEDDDVRLGLLEAGREAHVPRLAIGMTRRRHVQHRDALVDGPLHARADAVREHGRDGPAQESPPLRRTERPQVAPLPRHADRDAHPVAHPTSSM